MEEYLTSQFVIRTRLKEGLFSWFSIYIKLNNIYSQFLIHTKFKDGLSLFLILTEFKEDLSSWFSVHRTDKKSYLRNFSYIPNSEKSSFLRDLSYISDDYLLQIKQVSRNFEQGPAFLVKSRA
jgi:hypothetical protein